jgi:hypothetical protein
MADEKIKNFKFRTMDKQLGQVSREVPMTSADPRRINAILPVPFIEGALGVRIMVEVQFVVT